MTTHTSTGNAVTAGPVAGETLKDPARWPGHALVAAGLLAFALSLTGFAVGRNGAALAGVVTAVLLVAGGLGWLFVEHRRARAKLVGAAPERPEDAAPLS